VAVQRNAAGFFYLVAKRKQSEAYSKLCDGERFISCLNRVNTCRDGGVSIEILKNMSRKALRRKKICPDWLDVWFKSHVR